MLKTFELCPKKFYFRYVKNINMPTNDDIFEFGKNIHALASYYLKEENIDNMENALSEKEKATWEYLKATEYFGYELIGSEYNISVKINDHFYGGRLDALVKKDNQYYILDYKTGSIPKNPKFDFQTIIYTLAVKELFKTTDINFIYIDLKNKENIKITFTKNIEEQYLSKLIEITKKIETQDNFIKKTDCKCEYSPICF